MSCENFLRLCELEVLLVEFKLCGGFSREILREFPQLLCQHRSTTVEHSDALVTVVESDTLVDVAPVGSAEVGLDVGAGDDVDAMLGVAEGLEHSDERRPRVVLLVDAGAVVVELDDAVLVRLGHLVHDAAEPLEGALLPRRPVEVGAPRPERRRQVVCAARLEVAADLLRVVDDVLDDGDHGRGTDAEADEQHDGVLLVVLRRRAVRAVDPHLRQAWVGHGAVAVAIVEQASVRLRRLP
uniref:Uncharacterized protein n=1 Tax=Arundo donax TaxID=35708 RepID=A0A0A8XSR1_ARUDO